MLLILRCGDVHQNPGPTYENKSLNICHVNVQSLYLRIDDYHRRKIDEIESILIKYHKVDVICLSETWLGNDISDTQVSITGYEFHRKDRIENRAGGAAMYVNLSLPQHRAYELKRAETDLMWVQMELGGKKIFIGACYRPPDQSVDEVDLFMSNLEDSLEQVFNSNPESVFLLGDFNDSTPVWDSDHSKSELKLKLYDYINSHNLHQLILEPTYIRSTSANILDLLITDSPGYILNKKKMSYHLLNLTIKLYTPN
jgi:exonuclease III